MCRSVPTYDGTTDRNNAATDQTVPAVRATLANSRRISRGTSGRRMDQRPAAVPAGSGTPTSAKAATTVMPTPTT